MSVRFTKAQLQKLGIRTDGHTRDKQPAKRKKTKIRKPENPDYALFPKVLKADLGVTAVREYRFHPERKWRFDYAIEEHRIAIEVEGGIWTGGRHTRGSGFKRDMEKYNSAASMGWRLVRVAPEELISKKTFQLIKSML